MPTLVIIDPQPKMMLGARNQAIIDCILREIAGADSRCENVIRLELDPRPALFGPSDPRIVTAMEPLIEQKRAYVFEKSESSGADEIEVVCDCLGFDFSVLRICGFNTCSCVAETVRGLRYNSKISRIEMVQDACGDDPGIYTPWDNFPTHEKIVLIPPVL